MTAEDGGRVPWSVTAPGAPRPVAGKPHFARHVRGLGPWKDKDPAEPGRMWGRWRWLALLYWAALVGGSIAKAWRDTGGIAKE